MLFSIDAYDISSELANAELTAFPNDFEGIFERGTISDGLYVSYRPDGISTIGRYDSNDNQITNLIGIKDMTFLLDRYVPDYRLEEANLSYIDNNQNKILMLLRSNLTFGGPRFIVSFEESTSNVELLYGYPDSIYSNSFASQLIYENYMYLDLMNDEKDQTEIVKINLDTKEFEVFKEDAQLPIECFGMLCYFKFHDGEMRLYDENDHLIANLGSKVDRHSILGTEDAVYFNTYFYSHEYEKALERVKKNGDIRMATLESKTDEEHLQQISILSKLSRNGEIKDLIVLQGKGFMQFPVFDGRFITVSMFGSCSAFFYDTEKNEVLVSKLYEDGYCSSYIVAAKDQLVIPTTRKLNENSISEVRTFDRQKFMNSISR